MIDESARTINRAAQGLLALKDTLTDTTTQAGMTAYQEQAANTIAIQAMGLLDQCKELVADLTVPQVLKAE